MTRILPSEIQNPEPEEIIADTRVDILRREHRNFVLFPLRDDISSVGFEVDGNTVTIDYEARFVLGNRVEANLMDWKFNPIHTTTSTFLSGTITFTNVDPDVSRAEIFVINSGDERVSNRAEIELTIEEKVKHPDAPPFVEIDSEYEAILKQLDEVQRQIDDLNEVAGVVFDIFEGHHNIAQEVEEHIDLITGLSNDYSGTPLTTGDVQQAGDPSIDSRLFPFALALLEPRETDWSNPSTQNYTTTPDDVFFYSSSSSGKGPGDDPEKTELQDILPVSGTQTVHNETDEVDVDYTLDSQVLARIDEIDNLINDFNSSGELDEIFDERYELVSAYSNRIAGFKMLANSIADGLDALRVELRMHDFINSETGLE